MKPRFADAYSNLAMALSLLGNHRKAAEAYRRAIQINPQFAEAHNNLGVACNRLGQVEKGHQARLGNLFESSSTLRRRTITWLLPIWPLAIRRRH